MNDTFILWGEVIFDPVAMIRTDLIQVYQTMVYVQYLNSKPDSFVKDSYSLTLYSSTVSHRHHMLILKIQVFFLVHLVSSVN